LIIADTFIVNGHIEVDFSHGGAYVSDAAEAGLRAERT